ncbi:carboxypeptidase regulatory-like domain-containing protein [Hymenobacter puniceus]|uniref:carboxypeptidase regulatory-like domain-containing protein n=1 Tax=Hymenobacter sp. BT190 TaxID=2763505 RepID=UPI001651ACEC|nr:carboxypeptidase regulatory-like domain-containing protein [Hymenobacter sp. BT190]MBC6698377.1 carboxypeptidase regulatory-like domain-containing protein [Hymenobacter sp. BT190]
MFTRLYVVARLLVVLLLGLTLLSCEDDTIEPLYSGSVEGTVLDGSNNNTPLVNAVITTNPATSSYVTDAQGRFSLPNIAVGKYAISIRKADFKTESVNVQVDANASTSVTVVLEKTSASNVAPNVPFSPTPATGAVDQPVELTLKWRVSDPNGKTDSLRSEVILYEGNNGNQQTLVTNTRDTTVVARGLKYNTAYLWQVIVRDKAGLITRGNVWSFRTRDLPDNPYLYVRQVGGNTDIYSSDATGGNLIRLTNSPFVEAYPRLSPLLDKVAYTSNASGQYRLYTMNRDGSEQRLVSQIPIEGYHNFGVGFCWSPDGGQFIIASNDKLWRINRDGTGAQIIATAPANRHFRECDWNSQNNRILVQTVGSSIYDSEIYILNADGSNLTQIVGNLPGRLDSPSFNLLGNRIMYTNDVDGFMDATGRQTNAQIFIQNLDGSGKYSLSAIQVTGGNGRPEGFNDVLPRFTGNGAQVIFVQVRNVNQAIPEVWQVDLNGRNRVRLFENATQPDAR